MRGEHATGWAPLALSALALSAAACSAPAPAVSYVVTEFAHERPAVRGEDVVAHGLDLDGRHDMVEGAGCTRAIDFISPAGEAGIDNQYAAALVGWLDAALGDTSEAVNAVGASTWIVDVYDIDDLRDDVRVDIYEARHEGTTLIRSSLVATRTGRVVSDWLDVELGSLPLPMGEVVGTALVEHAHLRLRLFPGRRLADRIEGDLAGSVSLPTVLGVSNAFTLGLDLEATRRMAMPDLDWDGDGECEAVSLGIGVALARIDG